ncbi:Bro-N domain-containing protein [Haemophilus parahaemolyticus]|uniref:BRO-N domain-containing protein n=1 Tax=Haemophilus parahaemolyticus TaxID=735 RepID=UPI0028E23D3A|nr:Bro-N domain-containing protein [Haemophilus parahaemolyticus]
MTTLTFQNTTLSVINQNNQTFLTASDLGKALDYSDADRSVRRLYTANADEFTAEMTALIEMQTAGGIQKVRIFSLRGAHLIAMFARTKVAKDFRKWVLDILDREVLQKTKAIQPLADEPLNLLVQAYHFLYQASDLRTKVQPTFIGIDIDRHFGSHYLHNLGKPLSQCMENIQAYIHASAERLMFVQGMASLLETPTAKKAVFK